ncbi:MAG TPA: peptidyl-prolyl cis-trans isomerase, partial [Vicinamibacteria bacterium]|nr:peptidyl-prolyl cis-trans isomerase [Vicinamibacteria bacterium]
MALLAPAEVLERVIVVVNGDIVTQSEFEQRQVAAVQTARIAPSEIERYLRENNARILQEAIDDLLLVQRAEELGYKVPASYLDEVIAGIRKDNNIASDADLQEQLRREGMTLSDLRRNIERQVLRRQVLSRELESRMNVTEAEARAEYQKNRAQYERAPSVTLREIVVQGEDAEVRARAEDLVRRARAGEDFAGLARAHSAAASATSGGELGQLSRNDLAPDLARVVFALPKGGVTDAIVVDKGYRVLKVEDRSEGGLVAFDEVKGDILRRLTQERASSEYETYIAGLRKTALVDLRVREVPLQVTVPSTPLLEAPALPGIGPAPAPAAPAPPPDQ